MAATFHLTPKALNAKDAAAYLGISERQLAAKVKGLKLRKQPDGAFSIKHLDEYQRSQEAVAGYDLPLPAEVRCDPDIGIDPGLPQGYVYFIASDNAVKIGYSTNPGVRLKTLQTGHDERLRLVATIPASPAKEKELHKQFKRLRMSGEWFALSPELAAFLAEVDA